MSKPAPHKRPSLGPLEKAPKKRFTIDPNTKVLIKQIARGVGVFTVVGLFITTIWYVTRLPVFTITTVTAEGGETIDAGVVQALAERELEGEYGKLIPKRFFAFYPQVKMLEVVNEVDRIKDVVIERTSRNHVAVTFGEYTPFALWCKEEESEDCLFIDEQGYAFAPAPKLSGGSFIRYRSGAVAPEIGTTILSAEDFWSTVTFIKLSEVDKRFVRSVEVDSARDVYYELVGGSELRAALSQSPEEVASNVHTILNSKEFKHLKPGNFKYIDLRFGNKVYVNEQLGDTLATTTATSSAPVVSNDTPEPADIASAVSTTTGTPVVDEVTVEW